MEARKKKEAPQLPQDAGMTLFEVMIAAGVTLVAIVAAMGSIVSIATTSTVSETQMMAATIVSTMLERIGTMPLEDLTALNPPTDLARRSGTTIQVTCYDTSGNPYQTPFDSSGISLPNPLPVEVTVTWRDDQGRTYSKRSSVLVGR